jgi:hypothetical protein
MSETKVTLTSNVARALLLDVAEMYKGYNEAWNWWAYEADDERVYHYGGGVAKREQLVSNDSQLELILSITPDMEDETIFFRVRGEESSYGRDRWDATVTEVKPTPRIVRIYE